MRPDLWRRVSEWQGVAFAAVVIVATLWLAATSRLNLYIHPRYIVFTVVMAVIGLAFVIAACARRLVDTANEHEHEHDDPDKTGPLPGSRVRTRRALSIVGMSVTAILALGLIVVPPATLTSATAGQRAIIGVMLESHLVAGTQAVVPGQPLTYGQSITDACIAWDDSLGVLQALAESVQLRRNHEGPEVG